MALSSSFSLYHYTKCYELAAHEAKFDSDLLTSLIANSLLFDLIVAVAAVIVFAVAEVAVVDVAVVGLTVATVLAFGSVAAFDVVICCGGGRGNRRRNHECFSAAAGVIRYSGSHSRQQQRKFMNNGSSHPLSALRRLFEPGGPRSLPCRDVPAPRITRPSSSVSTEQYRG